MAAAHRAILQTKHRVEVKAGLPVIALRRIADQAEDFALLVDSDPLIARRLAAPVSCRTRLQNLSAIASVLLNAVDSQTRPHGKPPRRYNAKQYDEIAEVALKLANAERLKKAN